MGGSRVRSLSRPPPSHRYRTQFSFFALVPPEWGSFESLRVSVSVSKRRNGGFYAPVSASKISVPDSDVRDRFDDWVGGWQFGPFRLHHPHSVVIWSMRRTRNCAAVSKTCRTNSLVSWVSAPSIEPNEPISPLSLCGKKFRS